MSTLASVIQRGTRALQPLATAVPVGGLYFVTDESVTERSSGSAWQTYGAAGFVKQVVRSQTGVVATGTTVIPFDNTIPQITEGNEYMTLAVTPTSAASKLKIDVVLQLSNTVANWYIAALFQDATASALAATCTYQATAGGGVEIAFSHSMTAGTTSATTFRVRAGGTFAGTTTFNGNAGTGLFGGVTASSITITETTS